MTNKQGNITAVGLGPGDAELLTLKGFKALQNADIVFYPVSIINGEAAPSFSMSILSQMELNVKVEPLHIPMKTKETERFYKEAFEKIKREYDAGCNVVIVSEGDILFYSTFGYLLKHIRDAGLPCSLVPGIPAFVAANSLGRQSLVEGNNSLLILPCPGSFEEIKGQLTSNLNLVIMKLSKLENWSDFLKKLERPFLYAERVGLKTQFVTNNPDDLAFRRIPYFSLLIIYG